MIETRTWRILFFIPAVSAGASAAGPLTPVTDWDRDRAAHLLRRAGWGGTPEQVDSLAALGPDAAVASLVDYAATTQTHAEFAPVEGLDRRAMRRQLRDMSEEDRRETRERLLPLNRQQMDAMRAWWLERMVLTPRPLEEKMTLFWHGHFTSGAREVKDSSLMWEQNEFLRKHALGSFRDLLTGISRDGAMLRYLDNVSNKKRSPNENYARELLELFTLGEGHYTEVDVREAARAFTGWTLGPDGFEVAERQHDRGVKTFLGRTGNFSGDDIIGVILDQPAAAEFLARKLLRYFVIDEPPNEWVRGMAYELKKNSFDFKKSLRTLFRSEMFYDRRSMFSLVKSPVELVVGSLRVMEVAPDDAYGLANACRAMGQDLFQPPNVAGWEGGRAWINTASLFERYNFAKSLLAGSDPRELRRRRRMLERTEAGMAEIQDHMEDYPGLEMPREQPELKARKPAAVLTAARERGLRSADELVDHFANRLLQRPVSIEQRKALVEVLGEEFDAESKSAGDRVREMVNVIMAMPEYQLN